MSKTIGKYSFGIGDRFAHQGQAQLRALLEAKSLGVDFIPVWNKSKGKQYFKNCYHSAANLTI